MYRALVVLAALTLVACSKGKEYQAAGGADTTTRVVVPEVDAGLKKDTVTVPVIETKKETLIVNKPVITKKKVEVKRPTVEVKKP